jgi:hypothetical protein
MKDSAFTLLTPLTQFICDTCGKVIEKPEDGWFEWSFQVDSGRFINDGFRICHDKLTCRQLDDHEHATGNPLSQMVFPQGLPHLYNLLDVGPYHQKQFLGPEVKDFRGYMDIIRRITIPYYEEARQYWDKFILDDNLPPVSERMLYTSSFLIGLIERYSQSEK